jgi:hypothetical protein
MSLMGRQRYDWLGGFRAAPGPELPLTIVCSWALPLMCLQAPRSSASSEL